LVKAITAIERFDPGPVICAVARGHGSLAQRP